MKTDKRTERCIDLEAVQQLYLEQLPENDFRAIHILRPLAEVYLETNQLKKAEPLLRAILLISLCEYENPLVPSVHDARLALAQTLQKLQQFEEASMLYKGCMSFNDCDATVSALFHCLLEMKDYGQATSLAEEYIARANQLEGDARFTAQVTWYTNLSNCYVRQGKYAKAAQQFEHVVRVAGEKSEALVIPFLGRLSELYRSALDEVNHTRVRELRSELRRRFNY